MILTLTHYLVVASLLFGLGLYGAFTRRNAVALLLAVELMLLAVALLFTASSCAHGTPGGQVFVLAGQLHVAPPHLPAAVGPVLQARGRRAPSLTVYQNAEAIWFELQRQGREIELSVTVGRRPGNEG